jgi:hypothetical protein
VLQYRLINFGNNAYTSTYVTSMQKLDGYREGVVSATSTKLQPGSVTHQYDANGNLIKVTDSTQSANSRTLVNAAAGHVLYREQAGNKEHFVFANDQQVDVTGRQGPNVATASFLKESFVDPAVISKNNRLELFDGCGA